MGGGLMQLVAYGAQDVYLTGEPQITFFKVVYRRHTNFSVEPIEQTFNGAADFGRTVTCNINRNGDLISAMYVVVDLQQHADNNANIEWGYVRRLGHAVVESCKIEIGGSKIDEHYSDWLNVWYELTKQVGHNRGYAKMVGDVSELTNVAKSHPEYRMYVPLQFWFNRNNGLALPLIALQYHDVRLTLKFRDVGGCVNVRCGQAVPSDQLPRMKDAYLLIDYVYLDSEERKRFAQAQHEYLIEQLQFTGSESIPSNSNKYRLNYNHPSKFLVWVPHLEKYARKTRWLAYASDGNWERAKEDFAKRLWLALRVDSDGELNTGGNDSNEVTQPPVATGNRTAGGKADLLSAKIDAQVIFANEGNSAPANEANVVLLKNELTAEDLSTPLEELGLLSDGLDFALTRCTEAQDHFNSGNNVDGTDNPCTSAKLQLNGHDRFTARDGHYFNYVQSHRHFSNTPADGVNVYSFALEPEKHQPSGTCNFSRIDNTTLNVNMGRNNKNNGASASPSSNSVLNIYTVNYNVLRVMSGMAGVAYSN
ncbi:major capsid protein [Chlorella virus XW01]|nr:major capsid protein [Chlorella virus XW01]